MTPKDWNTQEEAIAVAKAEILAAIGDTDARLELGMVKSIQSGTVIVDKSGGAVTVQISPVDVSKAILLISGGGPESFSTGIWTNHVVGELDASGRSFQARKGSTTMLGSLNSDRPKGYWQVIEFY